MEAGDELAADEYAKWLKNLSPDRLHTFESTEVFFALCRFPESPKLADAARVLFLKDSPYYPLHSKLKGRKFTEFVGWPMIGVPEFRQMVKQELSNVEVSEATLKTGSEEGRYGIDFGDTRFGRAINDSTAAVPTIKEQSLRVCDVYAWSLQKLEGATLFEPYWPQERRDAAIVELISLLDRFGDCYRLLPTVSPDRIQHSFNEPEFHLSQLDHAATPDDAKNGRAIFSLHDGNSEVRQAELPRFPQMARWKTLDKFPIRYHGKKGETTEYDRAGYIWQAEEILIDGKWQRFYGFVGNHIIAKVPAEEIEFLQKPSDDRHLRW